MIRCNGRAAAAHVTLFGNYHSNATQIVWKMFKTRRGKGPLVQKLLRFLIQKGINATPEQRTCWLVKVSFSVFTIYLFTYFYVFVPWGQHVLVPTKKASGHFRPVKPVIQTYSRNPRQNFKAVRAPRLDADLAAPWVSCRIRQPDTRSWGACEDPPLLLPSKFPRRKPVYSHWQPGQRLWSLIKTQFLSANTCAGFLLSPSAS